MVREGNMTTIQKLIEMGSPFIIFFVTVLVGNILRRVLFRRLSRFAKNTKSEIDDVVINAARGSFGIWAWMLGIFFAIKFSKLPADVVLFSGKILLVLGIFSVTVVLSNIATRLIRIYAGRIETALPVTSLTQNVTRIIIFGVGILIILNSLGIPIMPILATLGVGGLAVALALQDTLSNLFAGFHIIASRQIKVGDYIKLESGEEGYVTDIDWRITKIRLQPNNIVLVPNNKLTQTIIVNYSLPEREMATVVDFGVHYKSDLEKVEQVVYDVARETLRQVSGGVKDFEPVVRYHGLGESSIDVSVVLRVKEFSDQPLIKHEFIKRLHRHFQKEGIIFPYPVRAINYEQEKGTAV